MKQDFKQTLIIIMMMSLAFFLVQCTATAQTLTINPKIQLDGKYTLESVKVTIIDLDTVDVYKNVSLTVIKKFDWKLEDNKNYLIVFEAKGYQSKSVMITTNYTSNTQYMYTFEIDLSSKDVIPNSVRYAGGIFYDKRKKDFVHFKTKLVEFAEN